MAIEITEMTLDELAETFPAGTIVRDLHEQPWEVLGVVLSLPREAGGPKTKALLARHYFSRERIGHLYPDEVEIVPR